MDRQSSLRIPSTPFVSTGSLPPGDRVTELVTQAYDRFSGVSLGQVSQVYPALARVSPELFGISVVGADGSDFSVGAADHEFTIMSVSKPFVFALVCDRIGRRSCASGSA